VLSTFFPEQRDHLNAMVTEAGLSRMYGGIHYRFDIEAGQALGHSVARFTIAADASGNSLLTPHYRNISKIKPHCDFRGGAFSAAIGSASRLGARQSTGEITEYPHSATPRRGTT